MRIVALYPKSTAVSLAPPFLSSSRGQQPTDGSGGGSSRFSGSLGGWKGLACQTEGDGGRLGENGFLTFALKILANFVQKMWRRRRRRARSPPVRLPAVLGLLPWIACPSAADCVCVLRLVNFAYFQGQYIETLKRV